VWLAEPQAAQQGGQQEAQGVGQGEEVVEQGA